MSDTKAPPTQGQYLHQNQQVSAQAAATGGAGAAPAVKVHPFVKVIARALAEAAETLGSEPDSMAGRLSNTSFQGAGSHFTGAEGVRDRRHQSVLRYESFGDSPDNLYELKLRYASRVLACTALRMMVPRIKLLYQQLLLFRKMGKVDTLVKRFRDGQLQYKMSLFFLLEAPEFAPRADEFRRATGDIPADIEIFTLHTDELIDSYLAGLERVLSEFAGADQAFLDALAGYIDSLVMERQNQKRDFLGVEKQRLGAQFDELMKSLDGTKLHSERETLRRDLESARAQLGGLDAAQPVETATTGEEDDGSLKKLFGVFGFGRRLAAAGGEEGSATTVRREANRALEAKIEQMERRFSALERVKDKLISTRDELRQQLTDVEAALGATAEENALQSVQEGLMQARIMSRMQERMERFERLRRLSVPLQVFRGASSSGDSRTQSSANTIAQAVRSIDMVTASSSMYEEINDLIQKLLAVYWSNPTRALAVFQYEAKSVRELTRPGASRISQPMNAWFEEVKEHAAEKDESLRQFLTTLRITAPEEIRRHVEAEFHFLYSPKHERGY